jgi:flagellar secretion chaperone FliS
MYPPRGLESYRQTEVQSRTPVELVVMLYDGALRFLGNARAAIDRRDIRARREAIDRVLAIISELQSTLNIEQGGKVAAELDRLYSYCNIRLLDASMQNSTAPLDEVRKLLEILRDAWSTIATQNAGAAR